MNSSIDDYHDLMSLFTNPPKRVVSLVPSLTESMFDLGFGEFVVGITDYCIHPANQLSECMRIGGPKTPRIQDILSLQPDLILANKEENTPESVHALQEAGIKVWLTFPTTVRQAVDCLWVMAGVFQSKMAALRLEILEHSLDWAIAAGSNHQQKTRYFCPIWQSETNNGIPWWMTFNRYTYMNDLLDILGGENIFSDRNRYDPAEAGINDYIEENEQHSDTRYPRVLSEEIIISNPDLILLPDEPYSFGKDHQEMFYEIFNHCTAAKQNKIILVDGSLLMWWGTRLARALEVLPALLN